MISSYNLVRNMKFNWDSYAGSVWSETFYNPLKIKKGKYSLSP